MGIFDKVEKDAEDLAQNDPRLAQQAGQLGGGQLGQDMQTAQNMIGKQRGAPDQDQYQGEDGTDQAQGLNTDPGQGQVQSQDEDPGQGEGR